mmetsp:Transcript_22213/g.18433  ORF Transcript_22213/g.18433 Transcript_22213/m.18433 type:complete len:105 (+) Transcript_22213:120-434(+)
MVCSLLVILVGDGMHQLIPSVARIWWCLIFVGIMMPLAWMPTMKEIAFVSALGIIALGRAKIPTPMATRAKLTIVLKLDEPLGRPMLLTVRNLLVGDKDDTPIR